MILNVKIINSSLFFDSVVSVGPTCVMYKAFHLVPLLYFSAYRYTYV